MNDTLAALLTLGDKLAAHVVLAASALALGIAVALPLAVWASRSRAVARAALGFASLVQTIPALALLALFFPVLLSLRGVFGESLPTLGFLPALLALALYALLPILRNAVTARARDGTRRARSGRRGGHDRLAEAAHRRGAACRAVRDGGRAHRGGVDHRRGDTVDHRRPAKPRRSDLRRAADAELVARAGRVLRGSRDWRWRPTRCWH